MSNTNKTPVPPRWRKEVESVLITDKMLAKRIAELGREIEHDFKGVIWSWFHCSTAL